jgi:hypothetical protein
MKKLLLILFCSFLSFSQAQDLGIVGPAANGWPTDDNVTDIMLTNNGDGTHSISELTLNTGPAKFRQDQNWTVSYGGDTFPSGPITGGDIPVQSGVYDIVVDLNTNTYTFTNVGTFEVITLSGSALDEPIVLSTANGDLYEATVSQFNEGSLLFTSSNGDVYGVNPDTPEGLLVLDGDPIEIMAGFYEVELFLDNVNYFFNVPDIGMVGPGASDWPGDDNQTPDVLLTTTDNGFVYTLESQELFEGEIKFRQNLNWDNNWGGSAFPAGDLGFNSPDNILVTQAGFYEVTFDRENLTYMFVSLSTSDVEFNSLKVYPNPSKGNWNILAGNAEINQVSVYSISGKLIQEMNVSQQGEIEIQAANLDSGMYMIKLSTLSGNTKTLKLIKQ